jgi:hypothetical protein
MIKYLPVKRRTPYLQLRRYNPKLLYDALKDIVNLDKNTYLAVSFAKFQQ